ncbi:hypothetical protein KTS45_18700 [Halomicroarcula limicola]|uniref:Uncharacterized protein n=1 Tax=Haloarcula limicola TaxID=1429915 RepID=A0A8J7YFG0_9EURY|nr:hypothetical protein [Halomicroarcula limicola]MBV0926241.1 hypothetical protein [Halomicroarcula limicola]
MSGGFSRDELADAVLAELLTYLQSGSLNTDVITDAIVPSELEISEWERLQRVHFCLAPQISEFCTSIWDDLRGIKTVTDRERNKTRGAVEGQVDWGQTIQTRAETGFSDRSTFVCSAPVSEYDIPENRVLKRLLWEVERTVDTLRDVDQPWRYEPWNETDLDRFQRRYRRNIHLSRMPDGEACTVTGRDFTAARQARTAMYRTAARWLSVLQKMRREEYADPDVQAVLSHSLVLPATDARLLELFTTFKLVKALQEIVPGLTLQPIESGDSPVARLANDETAVWIDVYHDQTGTLSFHEPLPDGVESSLPADPGYFRDYVASQTAYKRVAGRMSDSSPRLALYRGRPDIVVEIRTSQDSQPTAVLLGEVKQTTRQETFREGLKELIEYWHHGQSANRRLASPGEPVTLGFVTTNGLGARQSAGPCFHVDAAGSFQQVLETLFARSIFPSIS